MHEMQFPFLHSFHSLHNLINILASIFLVMFEIYVFHQ